MKHRMSPFQGKRHTLKIKQQIKKTSIKTWSDSKLKERFRKIMKQVKETHPLMHPKGEKHWNWQGGIAKERNYGSTVKQRAWRNKVFERDDYTCQKTKIRGGRLEAHHIKNAAQHPNLVFVVNNGIVLSHRAHREFHNKFGYKNNNIKQLELFLNS